MRWKTAIGRLWKLFAGLSVCLGFFADVGSVRSKIEGLYPFLESSLPLLGLASSMFVLGCWMIVNNCVILLD